MTQQETLHRKDGVDIQSTNNAFAVLLFTAALMALPLSVRAQATSAATTHAATTASAAATAPASETTPPPASEEVPLPQSHAPAFKEVDTNHDGKIEWKEAQAVGVPKKTFDKFDFDHSDALSQTEWLFVRLHMTDFTPPKGTVAAPAAATKK